MCSHRLLRPLVPWIVGRPVGLWGRRKGPELRPPQGSPGPSGSAACHWGHEAPAAGEKRHELPPSARYRGVRRDRVEAVSCASGVPRAPRLPRGTVTAFPSCCPSRRRPGPPSPGPARPTSCHPSAVPSRRPARPASPTSVVSSGPATPCSATGSLPLPDLARSWGLRPGKEVPGVRSEAAPASRPCMRPMRAGHTEQAWPGRMDGWTADASDAADLQSHHEGPGTQGQVSEPGQGLANR